MHLLHNEEPTLAQRFGLTKGKAILIGVLVIVFLAVIVVQFWPAGSPATVVESNESKKRVSPLEIAKKNSKRLKSTANVVPKNRNQVSIQPKPQKALDQTSSPLVQKSWPQVEIHDATTFNPFAIPSKFVKDPEPTAEERQAILEAKRQQEAEAEKRAELALEEQRKKEAERRRQLEAIALEKKRQQEVEKAIETIRNQGISLLIKTPNGLAVKIGDKLVVEGDVIDQIKIVEIRENGSLLLEPVGVPENHPECHPDHQESDSETSNFADFPIRN